MSFVLAAAAFALSGPLAGSVFAAVAIISAIVLWTPVRDWLEIPPSRSGHAPKASRASLADELEHLRGEGMRILVRVRPTSDTGTAGAETRDRQARPDVLAEDKQQVARWTRKAGTLVERKTPRFSLFFYGDDEQPIPLEPDTTREQLATCLDARLSNLEQIIRAVSGEES